MVLSAGTMPRCVSGRDFYDGSNFHFPSCPRHEPMSQAERVVAVMSQMTGASRLRFLRAP